MKIVTRVQTFDGVLHDDDIDAKRHVEKLYGQKLGAIVRGLCACDGKYLAMHEWIDAHLLEFVELERVTRDLTLENPKDDD